MPDNKSKIIMLNDSEADSTVGEDILGVFFEVYPAPTSAGFFELLEKVTPDLILLDMELPELDGDETIKKIKADSRFADIPVILLGSQNNQAGQLEGFNLGASDCIVKPFSGPIFLKRIVKQLLIVQKDKVTAARGKAAEEAVERLNELIDKKDKGENNA